MNEIITRDNVFVKNTDGEIIVSPDAIQAIYDIEVAKKKLDNQIKKYKEVLRYGMAEYGLKKFESDELLITYVEPTERLDLDRDKLWAEHKDIAFECQKFTPVSASVKVKVR